MYVDTHLHLSNEDYEDISAVIKNASQENVMFLIISGCEKKGLEEAIKISQTNKNVYLSLGFHPSEASKIDDEDVIWFENKIKSLKKLVAIGEIGLDYHYGKEDKELQISLFHKMLKIAEKLNLPVVIHSRDATQDTIDILKQYKVTGCIHCFSGSLETAKIYIKMGYKLGIGGVLTFKNSNLKDVIKDISIEDILLETDSPYLAPIPYRGNKNEPKYIPIIAKEISKIKDICLEEVATKTTNNAKKLYKFDEIK